MDSDMLSSLLSNPDALQNAMKTVSDMFGSGDAPAAGPAASNPAGPNPTGANPAGSNPAGFNPAGFNPAGPGQAAFKPAASRREYDPSAEIMEHALPVLSNIVQSGNSAIRPEKKALLSALKPFVTDDVAGQFDHAMRLVSMARMARAALGQLGPKKEADSGEQSL